MLLFATHPLFRVPLLTHLKTRLIMTSYFVGPVRGQSLAISEYHALPGYFQFYYFNKTDQCGSHSIQTLSLFIYLSL